MVNIADARVLARLGDALILVVRSGVDHARRGAAGEDALRRRRHADAGTILNFWNPKTPGYSYYKYYYAGYYHYYGDGNGNGNGNGNGAGPSNGSGADGEDSSETPAAASSGRKRAASASSTRSVSSCSASPQPQADIEVIALGQRILDALGIAERVVLELNTLGDPESRAAYRDALVGYFSARASELSEDSLRRLETQPAAHSRFEGRGRSCASTPRRRAFADYLNDAVAGFLRRACATGSTGSASRTGSTRGWCAASTTTRTPSSSS